MVSGLVYQALREMDLELVLVGEVYMWGLGEEDFRTLSGSPTVG